jgi:hypothetical protein
MKIYLLIRCGPDHQPNSPTRPDLPATPSLRRGNLGPTRHKAHSPVTSLPCAGPSVSHPPLLSAPPVGTTSFPPITMVRSAAPPQDAHPLSGWYRSGRLSAHPLRQSCPLTCACTTCTCSCCTEPLASVAATLLHPTQTTGPQTKPLLTGSAFKTPAPLSHSSCARLQCPHAIGCHDGV